MKRNSLDKMASTAKDHARIIWCMRLCSAFRAALACAIVGGATFYRPKFLADQLKFPAFSYVTVVLIVSDATLGDTLRGCWHALYATVQVVPLAMLGRWLVAPTASGGLPLGMAAIVAAVAAFLVVLPESTHLTAKRIALGQIALVCTEAVIGRDNNKYGFMHPLHIGASTALGALACVLALLLPFPGLAHYKVQKLCKVYAENASERINIYLKAFNAQDHQTKTELVLQAKPIAEMGNKLIQIIRISQEGMPWERPWSRYAKHDSINVVVNRLQSIELSVRAMEYSIVSSPSFPVQTLDQQQLSDVLQGLASQVQKKIDEIKHFSPFDSETAPQTRDEFIKNVSLPLESIVPIQKYESACFFFSCIDMLNDAIPPTENQNQPEKTESNIIQKLRFWFFKLTASERLESAFKYSISLGLAVLLGLIIERENGCWASLTVAISYVSGRQAIFTVANTRAQGTALGSVYGVICCFLFHHSELKLLAILPWIIFTSILRHSKMYGQTGGVTAAIGALLILGRNNYTNPNEFAIGRLTSVFIGLSCFVVVELLLQPIRAATLAKRHVFLTLLSFKDCLNETRFYYSGRKIQAISKFRELREKETKLKSLVKDADSEPDFWYLPFNTSCYDKLVKSLSNVANMLYFAVYNLELLSETEESCTVGKELQKQLSYELEELQETVNTLLEKVPLMRSIADQSQMQREDMLRELEEGKLQNREKLNDLIIEEALRITEEGCEDEKHLRIVRCLGAIGFCISSLRKEVDEVDICIKEIVRWENNSSK